MRSANIPSALDSVVLDLNVWLFSKAAFRWTLRNRRVRFFPSCQRERPQRRKKSTFAGPTSWRRCRRRCSRITAANSSSASAPAAACSPPAISPSSSRRNSAFATASSARLTWPTPRGNIFRLAPHTPIYLLGEIIHNPEVNDQIRNMGIQIISPKPTDEEMSQLQSGDAVIIPAFGTEVGTRKKLEAKAACSWTRPAAT